MLNFEDVTYKGKKIYKMLLIKAKMAYHNQKANK